MLELEYREFRQRLRALRRERHLTQEQAAEQAGMHYKHYQEIERGAKRELRFSTLYRLAAGFGIPMRDLFPSGRVAEPEGVYRRVGQRDPATKLPPQDEPSSGSNR